MKNKKRKTREQILNEIKKMLGSLKWKNKK